jgi:hypothetical protein
VQVDSVVGRGDFVDVADEKVFLPSRGSDRFLMRKLGGKRKIN